MKRLGDNMWLYIPNVGKPIRITSLQSVVGGVFNNADIMRLDYHVEYDVQTFEDMGSEYLLDLKAKTGAVAYGHLKMWVDKTTVVPTKIECYAATGLLIKTLYSRERKPFDDDTMRPAVLETDSPLSKGYKSVMVYARVKKRTLLERSLRRSVSFSLPSFSWLASFLAVSAFLTMMPMIGLVSSMEGAATAAREAGVATRGAQVMPFDLEQTIHVFQSLNDGGLQSVRAKDPANREQIALIQAHLKEEAEKFQRGDFSDPAKIHGEEMPGLAELKAGAGQIDVQYLPRPDCRPTFSADRRAHASRAISDRIGSDDR